METMFTVAHIRNTLNTTDKFYEDEMAFLHQRLPVAQATFTEYAKALAERYDGDRRIAYIDIRTCGNWGETHIMEMPSGTPAITYEDITNGGKLEFILSEKPC